MIPHLKNGAVRLIALVLLTSAAIQAGDPPASDLAERGNGRFTYYWFKVYDVACYLPPKLAVGDVLDEHPRRLSFTYLRDCSAKDLAKATTTCVAERIGKASKEDIDKGVAAINALWPAVAEGEKIELTYNPGKGTTVVYKGKELGTVTGADFGKVLFSIWLGDNPIDADLRKRLLAIK